MSDLKNKNIFHLVGEDQATEYCSNETVGDVLPGKILCVLDIALKHILV